jgi:hypothetical protein
MNALIQELTALLDFEREAQRDADCWGVWAIRTVEEHFVGRPLD